MSQPTRIAVVVAVLFAAPALAADIEAGRAKVAQVCGACHGVNGVSVNEGIPNLAAQRAGYIESQLKALKDGTRKNPIMNAMAAQLSAADIENVAAFYASQPGAAPGSKSPLMASAVKSSVTFPEGYKSSFVKYHTINLPATKQVRYYYANKAAAAAAKAGKPVTGSDGFFVPEKQLAYTGMATGAGWGDGIPEALRNGNWNYAVFTLDKKPRPGLNQAECLGCHKPLDKESYLFTLKELAAAK